MPKESERQKGESTETGQGSETDEARNGKGGSRGGVSTKVETNRERVRPEVSGTVKSKEVEDGLCKRRSSRRVDENESGARKGDPWLGSSVAESEAGVVVEEEEKEGGKGYREGGEMNGSWQYTGEGSSVAAGEQRASSSRCLSKNPSHIHDQSNNKNSQGPQPSPPACTHERLPSQNHPQHPHPLCLQQDDSEDAHPSHPCEPSCVSSESSPRQQANARAGPAVDSLTSPTSSWVSPASPSSFSFFDPLLNRPPHMVVEDQQRAQGAQYHQPWRPEQGLMIVVPIRLGLEKINAEYLPGQKRPPITDTEMVHVGIPCVST